MAYLTPEQIARIEEQLAEIEPKYNRLLLTFSHRKYSSEQAAEYTRHGYLRRLGTLRRCVENVFTLIPPETDSVPDRNVLHDAQFKGVRRECVWKYRQFSLGLGL
jgi:hypothetical protein